jgi:DNA-binding MarR family transcriptional regulator
MKPLPPLEPGVPETQTVDETVTELTFLLARVFKELRRDGSGLPPDVEAMLRGSSFTGRHWIALAHIADAGTLTISALSERLNVTLPTVSIVVHQLASYGLVDRQEDPTDRRRTIVRIAPVHQEWVHAALVRRTEPFRRTLLRLEPAERAAFVKAIHILADEAGMEHCRSEEMR